MTSRRHVVVLLAVALALGVPVPGMAQGRSLSAAKIHGQIVDAGGRGALGIRVELVKNSLVVTTTLSTTDGHFNFTDVPVGQYVVRTVVNGHPAGVRVSVAPGDADVPALIVLPSLAKASAQVGAAVAGTLSGVLNGVATVIAVTVTTIGNAVYVQGQTEEDQAKLEQVQGQAQNLLIQLGNQIIAANPQPGGGPPPTNPFVFIPTVPASNPG